MYYNHKNDFKDRKAYGRKFQQAPILTVLQQQKPIEMASGTPCVTKDGTLRTPRSPAPSLDIHSSPVSSTSLTFRNYRISRTWTVQGMRLHSMIALPSWIPVIARDLQEYYVFMVGSCDMIKQNESEVVSDMLLVSDYF